MSTLSIKKALNSLVTPVGVSTELPLSPKNLEHSARLAKAMYVSGSDLKYMKENATDAFENPEDHLMHIEEGVISK